MAVACSPRVVICCAVSTITAKEFAAPAAHRLRHATERPTAGEHAVTRIAAPSDAPPRRLTGLGEDRPARGAACLDMRPLTSVSCR
jgi:hypothetical protein